MDSLQSSGKDNKTPSPVHGPFRLVRRIGENNWEVVDRTGKKRDVVNVARLKPCHVRQCSDNDDADDESVDGHREEVCDPSGAVRECDLNGGVRECGSRSDCVYKTETCERVRVVEDSDDGTELYSDWKTFHNEADPRTITAYDTDTDVYHSASV